MNRLPFTHPRAALPIARHVAVQIGLGLVAGIPAGLGAWLFLELLDRAIRLREQHAPWLIWLLPAGAFVVGAVYHHFGGRAVRGTGLVIEEVHEPTEGVPRRMAPLIVLSTIAGHLFGASVGREGTALQMSASLSDHAARLLRIRGIRRRELLVASLAAGFGAVFGVPVAGAVFALEVQSVGRVRFEAVLASVTAAFTGDQIVRGLGYHHAILPAVDIHVDSWLAIRMAVAGAVFGAVAALFVWITHRVRDVLTPVKYPPTRAAIGGAVTALGIALFGRGYSSLSSPLAAHALGGGNVGVGDWLVKAGLTAVCLGAGIPGGEVTPLFVTGALLGAALAAPLGVPIAFLAAIGFVSVFGAAANTPIACTLLFVELFGGAAVVPAAVALALAYVCSGHRGIYSTQRIEVRKHS